MVLRLLAHNAEHWLSGQLNAYLRDDDEYRAITRETITRGTVGLIAFTPGAVTVTLAQPAEPRVARALALLIDQINATPRRQPIALDAITSLLTSRPWRRFAIATLDPARRSARTGAAIRGQGGEWGVPSPARNPPDTAETGRLRPLAGTGKAHPWESARFHVDASPLGAVSGDLRQ